MGCPDEDLIAAFARAELIGPQRETVESHLDGCHTCSQVVAELVRVFSDEHSADDGLLPASGDLAQTVLSEPTSERKPRGFLAPGDTVGRYRVLELVGSGNMGVVYAAYDPELDRRVALKLLRSDDASADKKTRLQREAQALARLSHPNVIAVHDVGSFRDRVWLAMEFVDGWTLTEWLRTTQRSWEQIRTAFVSAGRGLAAAHAAGLVHRDFKPDNVLIGRDDRVRVTDFGLARVEGGSSVDHPVVEEITDGGETPIGASMTATGAMVGTPAYMAPEQFGRGTVDALSDQFSFCVALYEAVWGKRPFRGDTLAELAAKVIEGVPEEPPRDGRVSLRVRRAVLRGLSRHRTQRFVDMQALLGELESRRRRRWKALLWLGVPAAFAAGGALSLDQSRTPVARLCRPGSLDSVWGDARVRDLEKGFAATGLAHASQTWGAVQERVDQWVARWEGQRVEVCSPELEGGALLSLRMVCLERKRDELGAVLKVLEQPDADVVRRAPAVVAGLPDLEPCADPGRHAEREPPPPPPELEPTVAQLRVQLAQVKAMLLAGRYEQALEQAKVLHHEAEALGYEPIAAHTQWMLGTAWSYMGRNETANDVLHASLYRAVAAGDRRAATRIMIELVYVVGHQNQDHGEAQRLADLAKAELEALGGNPSFEAARLINLGGDYVSQGRAEEALELMTAAYELLRDEAGPVKLADVLLNVATIEMMLGRHDDAEAHFVECKRLYFEGWGEGHPAISDLHQNHAQMLFYVGRYEEAEREVEKALDIRARSLGKRHPEYGKSLAVLAAIKSQREQHDEAVALQREAITITLESYDPAHPRSLVKRGELVTVLRVAGRFEEAEREAREVLALARERLGLDHPTVGEMSEELAKILVSRDAYEEALSVSKETEAIYVRAGQPEGVGALESRTTHAEALYALGRYAEVVRMLKETIPLIERREGMLDMLPALRVMLAQAQWEIGEDRAARVAEVGALIPALQAVGADVMLEDAERWLAQRTKTR